MLLPRQFPRFPQEFRHRARSRSRYQRYSPFLWSGVAGCAEDLISVSILSFPDLVPRSRRLTSRNRIICQGQLSLDRHMLADTEILHAEPFIAIHPSIDNLKSGSLSQLSKFY